MKTIIAGSRTISLDPEELQVIIDHSDINISEVVCGGARGIDLSGRNWAQQADVSVSEFPADWNKLGKAAGFIRNTQMAEYANALILVWDGQSRGSQHMLKQAHNHGLTVHEYVVVN